MHVINIIYLGFRLLTIFFFKKIVNSCRFLHLKVQKIFLIKRYYVIKAVKKKKKKILHKGVFFNFRETCHLKKKNTAFDSKAFLQHKV
jgi:hypothetical protein